MKSALEPVITRLERAGAKLKAGWPAGYRPAELLDNYLFHLFAFLETGAPPGAQEAQRKELANFKIPRAGASLSSFSDWQQQNHRRLAFRAQWQSYFEEVDVFLSPVAFTPAFPHDHSEPQGDRTIATPDGPRRYVELLNWIAAATLTGCPRPPLPLAARRGDCRSGFRSWGPIGRTPLPSHSRNFSLTRRAASRRLQVTRTDSPASALTLQQSCCASCARGTAAPSSRSTPPTRAEGARPRARRPARSSCSAPGSRSVERDAQHLSRPGGRERLVGDVGRAVQADDQPGRVIGPPERPRGRCRRCPRETACRCWPGTRGPKKTGARTGDPRSRTRCR